MPKKELRLGPGINYKPKRILYIPYSFGWPKNIGNVFIINVEVKLNNIVIH